MFTPPPNSNKQNLNFDDSTLKENTIAQAGRDVVQTTTITIHQTQTLPISEQIKKRDFKPASPYQGLKKFMQDEHHLFFGRTKFIEYLLEKLEETNMILILGASGSGKSSVVRAGLIHNLSQILGERFVELTLTPNNDPFESLYSSLVHKQYTQREAKIAKEAKADTLNAIVKKFKKPDEYWLIFIDQFEELFTISDAQKRDLFIDSLVKLHETKPDKVKIVGTMRGDFTDQLSRYSKFSQATDKYRPILADMQEDELRDAIEQPAAYHGVVLENGLIDEIIKDIKGGEKSYLPLLQYTLNLVWENELNNGLSQERTLKISTYKSMGGVKKALEKHMDSIYNSLLNEEQAAVKSVFLKLVEVRENNGNSGTSPKAVPKRVSKSIFASESEQKILEKLINEKLLIGDSSSENKKSTIEISHETLLTSWEKLRTWIQENQAAISTRISLIDAVTKWKDRNKSEDELWRGSKLAQILEKRTDPNFNQVMGKLSQDENEFIDASVGVRDAVRKREKRWMLILKVVSFVAIVAALIAGGKWWEAERQEKNAKSQQQNAESRYAQGLLVQGRAFDGLIESLRLAVPIYRNKGEKPPMQLITALQEAVSGRKETQLEGHNMNVLSVAYSPNGQTLASGGRDGSVKLWNAKTHIVNHNLPHGGMVGSVAFSPNGELLASGGNDKTVKIWDVKTGEFRQTFGQDGFVNGYVNSVAFSPNGQTVAAASGDGKVYLWNVNTREPKEFQTGGYVYSIAFSPNGQTVAAGGDGKVYFWNVETGQHQEFRTAGSVYSIVFSPDGQTVAFADNEKKVKFFDVKKNTVINQFWHGAAITNLTFSEDGQTLASAGRDGTVKVWNIKTGYSTVLLHGSWVHSVSFNKDASTIASGSSDGHITLWDKKFWLPTENQNITTFEHDADVNSVALSSDSQTIAAGANNGSIKLWNVNEPKKIIHHLPHDRVTSLAFTDNSQTLASGGADGTVKLWNAETGQFIKTLWHGSFVSSVAFSANGETLASGGADGTVKLWNAKTYQMTNPLPHGNQVTSVAFSANGETLASGSGDGTVKLWNAKTGQLIKSLSHGSFVYNVAFSPDGQTVVSGGGDGMVKLWDVNTSTDDKPKSLLKHGSLVYSVTFNKDGILASGGWNGRVKFWDIKTGNEEGILFHPYYENSTMRLAFSKDGKSFISTSDKRVFVWNLDFDKLVQQGCEQVSGYLKNSPNVSQSDKTLCDKVPKPQPSQQ